MPTTSSAAHIHRGTLALLRNLVPNRRVSQTEGLRIAELQAARLREHLGITTPNFPLQAIVDLPRVEIRHDPDLLDVSGMSFWNGRNWIILIDPTEAKNRRRFSILHEFKHIVDYKQEGRLYGTGPMVRSQQAEAAADYFSACLHMPKMMIKRHWGQGPRTVSGMAKLFKVSPAAMRFRLDQLGLVEHRRRCSWPVPADDLWSTTRLTGVS